MKVISSSIFLYLVGFSDSVSAAVCQAVPNLYSLKPGQICGKYGILSLPQALGGIYSPAAGYNTTCQDICMQNTACKSFSYTQATNQCKFYKADVSQMFFIPIRSNTLFWSENCFIVPSSCPAASSTNVPSLPSSSVSPTASNSASTTTASAVTSPTSTTTSIATIMATIQSTTTTIASSISLGPDFTVTYTYQEYILPTFTTGPVSLQQQPASTNVPPVVSPSPSCMINPDSVTSTFSVLSSNFTYIIPKNGKMTVIQAADLPSDIVNSGYTPPTYYFQKGTIAGAYDLLVKDTTGKLLYVGFDTLTGSAVTTTASSASGRYITSVFGISCGGLLSINLNSVAYIWQPAANGIATTIIKGTQTKTNTMLALPKAPVSASTTTSSRRKRQINYEGGQCPRCPNTPPSLKALVANNARPAEFNGCGSGSTASVVPQLSFGQCCNRHDLCFDDCQGGYFEQCNSDFYNCMDSQCSQISTFWHPLDKLQCKAARDFYSWVVEGSLGRYAFYQANYYDAAKAVSQGRESTGRCNCACSSGNYCNGNCVNYQSDNNNCGGCGIQCTGTNICVSGQCSCPFNTQTDNNNCGACGIQCPSWSICKTGQCSCPKNTCGNLCVDFQNHPRNCGSCGNVCSSGYCTGGQCVTPPPDVCFPGDVIKNGTFDDGISPWMFNPDNGKSGAGFDGAADSRPNSCVLDYLGSPVSVVQNIAVCPGSRYQLTFQARNVDVSSSTCYWEAHAAGQQLGSGTLTNSQAIVWQGIGPLYMNALPSGTGTGTSGSADYTTYQYDSAGLRAYTQLAIIIHCSNSPAISRIDTVSFFPG